MSMNENSFSLVLSLYKEIAKNSETLEYNTEKLRSIESQFKKKQNQIKSEMNIGASYQSSIDIYKKKIKTLDIIKERTESETKESVIRRTDFIYKIYEANENLNNKNKEIETLQKDLNQLKCMINQFSVVEIKNTIWHNKFNYSNIIESFKEAPLYKDADIQKLVDTLVYNKVKTSIDLKITLQKLADIIIEKSISDKECSIHAFCLDDLLYKHLFFVCVSSPKNELKDISQMLHNCLAKEIQKNKNKGLNRTNLLKNIIIDSANAIKNPTTYNTLKLKTQTELASKIFQKSKLPHILAGVLSVILITSAIFFLLASGFLTTPIVALGLTIPLIATKASFSTVVIGAIAAGSTFFATRKRPGEIPSLMNKLHKSLNSKPISHADLSFDIVKA
jgi:hypothetical protein